MATLEEIIEVAKTKEKWTVGHVFNYGPIDYLRDHVVDNHADSKFVGYIKTLWVFWKNVHKVTDAETYFVWEHCKYDIYVDGNEMVVAMRRAFPDVPFKTVCEWLTKHEEPHQYTTGISPDLVPEELLEIA